MKITETFIQRPVMTTLLAVGMVFFGVLGYKSLPISYLPNVEFPVLQVTATFPGAAADTLAGIDRAQAYLPQDLPQPPFYQKVNPSEDPIIYLSVFSDTFPPYKVSEYGPALCTASQGI